MPLAQPAADFVQQFRLPLSRTRRCSQLAGFVPRISESDKTKRIVPESGKLLD
jgi:hypothetical protein